MLEFAEGVKPLWLLLETLCIDSLWHGEQHNRLFAQSAVLCAGTQGYQQTHMLGAMPGWCQAEQHRITLTAWQAGQHYSNQHGISHALPMHCCEIMKTRHQDPVTSLPGSQHCLARSQVLQMHQQPAHPPML